MTDLEAFGRHVGELRNTEPVTVTVKCHRHGERKVAVAGDEYVVYCCLLGSVDKPHRSVGGIAPGFKAWFGAELI